MKRFLIVAICLLMFATSFSQNKPKTKPKENPAIQNEMQKEIDELKKEIKRIEEEIKTLEKTDPAEAEAMKVELASLKNMLGMFDKKSKASEPSPKKETIANSKAKTNNSPLVPVVLKQAVTLPTAAQLKDKLLWYRGKKINDSTLITKMGMVVQQSKSRNIVVLQPQKKKDPFDKMVDEITKNNQRKEELVDRFDKMKNGFLYYPELKRGLELYDEIAKSFSVVVNNTIDLPQFPSTKNSSGNNQNVINGHGPFAINDFENSFYEQDTLEQHTKELKQQLEKAKRMFNELPSVSDFPAPPVQELGMCMRCDKNQQKNKELQDSIWLTKYYGKEQEIVRMVFAVENQKALLGIEIDMEGITDIVIPIFKRVTEKNKILFSRYGKDYRYSVNVIRVVLGHERQIQLLGYAEEIGNSLDVMRQCAEIINNYEKYFDEQAAAKNHDFVLDIASHIGAARQAALLGIDEAGTFFYNLSKKFTNYNRFALSIDLDFIYEINDNNELQLKATGSMTTKDKVYVMLIQDDCSYKMKVYNTDLADLKYEDISIPFIVKSGVRTSRDENNKLVSYSYSGPEGFPLLFPVFKIDFCGTQPDTAYFTTFSGDQGAGNSYGGNLNNISKKYEIDFLGFLNHIFQTNDIDKKEGNVENLVTEMMQTIAGFQKTDAADSKLEKLRIQYEGKTKMDNYTKEINNLATDKKSLLLFTANNRSTVLVDKYNDSKRKLGENSNLTRGLIHLKIVHEPVK